MGHKFHATLGFTVGLGTACLLNPVAYSRISSQAIALPLAQTLAHQLSRTSAEVQKNDTTISCLDSNESRSQSLSRQQLENASLFKHVPAQPQRLNWYSITQRNAIANAPKPSAPEPLLPHWQATPHESFHAPANCSSSSLAATPNGAAFLQEQSHFILSLGSLAQKNDWLLKPLPKIAPKPHRVWHSPEKFEFSQLNIALTTLD